MEIQRHMHRISLLRARCRTRIHIAIYTRPKDIPESKLAHLPSMPALHGNPVRQTAKGVMLRAWLSPTDVILASPCQRERQYANRACALCGL